MSCLFACSICNEANTHTHTHSQAASKHSNEQLLCFVFSSADPLQMTSPYRAGEKRVGFVCVLQYRVYGECWGGHGGGVGVRHTCRGTQPALSESRGAQENTGPPKQNTFYGNGYIYLHGSLKNHGRMAF